MATPTYFQEQQGLSSLLKTPVNIALDPEAVSRIVSLPPFLPIPGALNLRVVTAPNLALNTVYRSGAFFGVSPEAFATFTKEYNITTIFDLRLEEEVSKNPDPVVHGVEIVLIPNASPFLAEKKADDTDLPSPGKRWHLSEFVENGGVDGYLKMYGNVLENTHKDAYRVVFEHLKNNIQGGILFHCTAGKDRTGILSALILELVGTSREEIAHDYALTRVGFEPWRELLTKTFMTQAESTFKEPGMLAFAGVNGINIVRLLEWMDEKWGEKGTGGVEGYLIKDLGLSANDVEKIKLRLKKRGAGGSAVKPEA
ncbi:protein-tyrosine phosphatase-like protein [Amylocarpus encephaloides]|uniref:Protein-tyrosine phosphatase-like protein n=1 Tax=Amylocarpus encephaloides TaxID=45428 RepID=A0A9P7YNF0_9HELO|nr:protein-tyrosine phosphatase-like protein [Amylocarpus encephaloides]